MRTLYISVDAANRAWMSPVRTYIDPVEPGGVMRSMTLGQVVRSNYKTGDLGRAIRDACPKGIDVYFDNLGGPLLEAALFQMRGGGRIVCCGAVSQYDTGSPEPGPRGVPGLLVVKRLRMEGFIVMDFNARRREAEDTLARFIAEGRLVIREDIVQGLERAPRALIGLLHGDNIGKRMVRVTSEPE